MFYKEQKQKKIAKIKSKTYRKVHKKDKSRDDLSIEELSKLDPELAQEKVLKLQADRIKVHAFFFVLVIARINKDFYMIFRSV